MNLQFPELDTDGISIAVQDAGGNPAPLPDPATVTSTGKVGSGVTVSATLAFKSGAPSLTGTSTPVDVPAGPPASVSVTFGTPTPPAPNP